MTHLAFVAAAYAAAIGVFAALSVNAALRLRSAKRRLSGVDARRERRRP